METISVKSLIVLSGKKGNEGFKKDDLALAVIHSIYNAIVPCEVVGPVTEDYLRNFYEHDEFRIHDSFEEYLDSIADWNWSRDSMIVRPLVRLCVIPARKVHCAAMISLAISCECINQALIYRICRDVCCFISRRRTFMKRTVLCFAVMSVLGILAGSF